MNLLLLQPADLLLPLAGDAPSESITTTAVVDGDRLLHLRKVLKVGVGDSIRVGLLNGLVGNAIVVAIDRTRAQLDVNLVQEPPAALDVELLLALPRPKFLGRVLQHATTIGVKEITLFQSARVEKSFWSSGVMTATSLNRHLELGLEQGRDTILPTITLLRSFTELLQHLERTVASGRELLVAEGSANVEFPRQPSGPTALLIGPEGGLVGHEIDALVELGARCGSLGNRPLRVEAAVSGVS